MILQSVFLSRSITVVLSSNLIWFRRDVFSAYCRLENSNAFFVIYVFVWCWKNASQKGFQCENLLKVGPCFWKYPSIVQSSQFPCGCFRRGPPAGWLRDWFRTATSSTLRIYLNAIDNEIGDFFLIICWRWRHKIRTLGEGQKQPLSTIHSPRNAFIACAPTFGSI